MSNRQETRCIAGPALVVGIVLLATVGCRAEEGPEPRDTAVEAVEPVTAVAFPELPEVPGEEQIARLVELGVTEEQTGLPSGVDPVIWESSVPEDNQPTPERIALGRRLYFDPTLSADGTVACASCHDVTRGLTDRSSTSNGIGAQVGRRNAPTTANAALLEVQFWDGRAPDLETQARMPILNPIEMGQPDAEAAVAAIAGDESYQEEFLAAYGRLPNFDDIGRAIAAFERTLIFLDAPFDRFVRGDEEALSEDARAGWLLFNGQARCMTCHPVSPSAPLFTDNRFHNVGVAARHQDYAALAVRALDALKLDPDEQALDLLALDTDLSELGRFMLTRDRADLGGFRTPQLRNVGITAPYMHDGSMATLWDVMDHYNKGGEPNPHLDGGMLPLELSEAQIDQIVAFLFSLTDRRFAEDNETERSRQRAVSRVERPFRDEEMSFRERLAFEPEGGIGAPEQEEER